jgi:hypothetical protein
LSHLATRPEPDVLSLQTARAPHEASVGHEGGGLICASALLTAAAGKPLQLRSQGWNIVDCERERPSKTLLMSGNLGPGAWRWTGGCVPLATGLPMALKQRWWCA